MKALLVADNDTAIDNISTVLKAAGYDTIVYRWLLKALDNIEEIGPHLIIISTKDYPRHWKTLAQFVKSGIGGHVPQIVLYAPEDFSEDEKKKADALGVRGIFSSVEVEGLDVLRDILKKKDDIFAGKLTENKEEDNQPAEDENKTADNNNQLNNNSDEDEQVVADDIDKSADKTEINKSEPAPVSVDGNSEEYKDDDIVITEDDDSNVSIPEIVDFTGKKDDGIDTVENERKKVLSSSCSFIFTNPATGAVVTGTVFNYEESSFEFEPDFTDCIPTFNSNVFIENASLKAGDNIESVFASAVRLDEKTISIKIRRFE